MVFGVSKCCAMKCCDRVCQSHSYLVQEISGAKIKFFSESIAILKFCCIFAA